MSCFVLCSDLTDAWSKKPGTGDELLRSIKGRCILCSHLFIHLRRARHLAAVTPLTVAHSATEVPHAFRKTPDAVRRPCPLGSVQ